VVIGLTLCLWSFRRYRDRVRDKAADVPRLAWVWLLGSLAAFSFSQLRAERHFVPMIAPAALLIGCWVGRLSSQRVRAGVCAALVVVGIVNYLVVSLAGLRWIPTNFRRGPFKLYSVILESPLHNAHVYSRVQGPELLEWRYEEIVTALTEAQPPACRIVVSTVDHPFINVNNLRYALAKKGYLSVGVSGFRMPEPLEVQQSIQNADCVIAKSAIVYPETAERFSLSWKDVMAAVNSEPGAWSETGRWLAPRKLFFRWNT